MINHLISIIGPTAIGKTSLSISVAKYFDAEIISADSRQFYKEMRIGTAVPSKAELDAVKHHFIQHKSVLEPYSVGQFERDALVKLEELFSKHPIAVMVGGSGLYLKAVTAGLNEFPDVDPTVRSKLNEKWQSEGLDSLQKQLKTLDPKTYEQIAVDNPHRVIRALEICIGTGKPYSSFLKTEIKSRPFRTLTIGLTAERQLIYDRINERVDMMMNQGLLQEAKALHPFKAYNALNTVGYKELFAFLENSCDLSEAVSEIKKNTRRFAKRQLTWFNKDDSIKWFDFDEPFENIVDYLENEIKKPA
ncbi:MAG: tRNA (adenosine(37)-N6)-dimethylallyltransferase MiaA [Flavobacteriaceae bacterium]|nr:tRNA (adenosine(37)-N6)-dimethylallyltransferase MiaA [Bacteroidia bacterium]MBT8287498.1 tRNA (adenosine(37)-N6)-dimethylallyltransferase MiaA [Bacteroidia bacterium]NNF74769.1 tRNA (adenosine(37)-N6)-dimethylallyltransferase MiaA [Flavobacteriaceae bacterium]NNK72496.1 tRNA (adenosine(37)-N6)-dimethylallyltransferase MiaA [Flavobacteriaceae bacterium]